MAASVRLLGVLTMLCVVACSSGMETPDAGSGSDTGARDTGPVGCGINRDCDDGVYCNGPERCAPVGTAGADARGCLPALSATPCGSDGCDEARDRCESTCADADGDGAADARCGGTDCDDTDPQRAPGLPEVCDPGRDEDCDPRTLGNTDVDADGVVSVRCCNDTQLGRTCGTDCDDALLAVRPGAVELCNAIDDDCDGNIDENLLRPFFRDADRDLYGDRAGAPMFACEAPMGTVDNALDCEDGSAQRNPTATESCDGVDNNCNGVVDEAGATVPACTATFGSPAFTIFECEQGACAIDRCTSGHADCNARLDDGCETATSRDPQNCGMCGRSCGAQGICTAGRCDDYVAVAAGVHHTCAVRRSGVVVCLGRADARLGSGLAGGVAAGGMPTPVVAQFPPGITRVFADTAGSFDGASCATTETELFCTGANTQGALGDGTTTSRVRPVQVVDFPPSYVINFQNFPGTIGRVSVGSTHACAFSQGDGGSGTLHCWGANESGQLGRNAVSASQPRPAPVVSFSTNGLALVAAGHQSTCATANTGFSTVFCVGANTFGELGRGSVSPRELQFAQVVGLTPPITSLDGSLFFHCATQESGQVRCWGRGDSGQLGDGPRANRSTASVPVAGISDAVEVATGGRWACARRRTGRVACWGFNTPGLGDGATTTSGTPVDVALIDDARTLSIGDSHACVLRQDASVWCWGGNFYGQLGMPAGMSSPVPIRVLGP